jgi:hypothetical protein
VKSYLTNRSQKVAIKEALSELDDLKAGVPQGSVLGPLLFLVFINDIADDMLGLSRLFADDTLSICFVHLQSLLIIMPKCLCLLTELRTIPSKSKLSSYFKAT